VGCFDLQHQTMDPFVLEAPMGIVLGKAEIGSKNRNEKHGETPEIRPEKSHDQSITETDMHSS
jgi:hypothetical protein